MRVVINGAGAAGTAIAKLLRGLGQDPNLCLSAKDLLVCDSRGIIDRSRNDLNRYKQAM